MAAFSSADGAALAHSTLCVAATRGSPDANLRHPQWQPGNGKFTRVRGRSPATTPAPTRSGIERRRGLTVGAILDGQHICAEQRALMGVAATHESIVTAPQLRYPV